jgi:2-haloacid dehalogenase
MSDERWATFDCYGTLVDWNAGIRAELGRVLGHDDAAALLARYHELEPEVQRQHPSRSYRQIMAEVLVAIASEVGGSVPAEEQDALGRSLPGWPVFEEVPAELDRARTRGWRMAALTNSDRDLIEASLQVIGVPFEIAIVASEIGSYKPAHAHWRAFSEATGADAARHVHVAQSYFHDIAPASELGIPTVWINRLGELTTPAPTRELPDLAGLADRLGELVPP